MLITPSRIKRIKDLSIGPGVRKPRKKVLKGGKSLPTSTARERAISKKSRGPAGKILGKSKTIHSPHTKRRSDRHVRDLLKARKKIRRK